MTLFFYLLLNQMETSIINRLKQYSGYINEDDLFDFCIQIGLLDRELYCKIRRTSRINRLNQLFNTVVESGQKVIELVTTHLKEAVPDIDQLIKDENDFRKSTVRGSLPKLPPNYIKRESFANQIRQRLELLDWNEKLVVHGIMGYGKSCLINEVLNDRILRKYFDNNVFWVNLGEHNVNYLLQIMFRLYNSVCDSSNTPNKLHCPDDPLILKEKLKEIFLEDRLSNALLILDDVCNAGVLELFDFGCRTVITTQNKDMLKNENAYFVEVNAGFSLEEAMDLFKLSLETKERLPLIAEQIFTVCKGHPMLIALIGSYLNENRNLFLNHHNAIWEYILTMFLKGDYRLNEHDIDITVPTAKIQKCVDKLLENNEILKNRYKDLAIFQDDVNIPPEVLEILWDTTESDVRNTMNKFAGKSLIVIFYNTHQQRLIYAVHSIHLHYLKEEMKSQIHDVHKKLIKGYDKITGGNYALLPDDNYSFNFIANHLYLAQEYHRFNIFLNLEFLQAKVKAVGKDDTLKDMDKYEKYIINNDEHNKKALDEYKNFIKKYGSNLFNFPQVDIIQYALQENENCIVYKRAYAIAQDSKHLYFNFLEAHDDDLSELEEIVVKDEVTAACYVDSPKHILLGCRNGEIKLFYELSEKEMCTFINPNSSPIKSLIISGQKSHFLSVSEDGIVNLWRFPADGKRNSFSRSGGIDSPKTKQKFWQDMFNSELLHQARPERIFKMHDDSFTTANFHQNYPSNNWIVTGSASGNCCVWDTETGKKIFEASSGHGENTCVLLTPEYLMFSSNNSIFNYKIRKVDSTYKADYASCIFTTDKVKQFYLNGIELISINQSSITVTDITVMNRFSYKLTQESQNYECISMTNDSKYIIVSTNKNEICFWDTCTRRTTRVLRRKWLTKSMDSIYDKDNSFHILLIGTDKKFLLQYPVQPFSNDNEKIICSTSTIFPPYWKDLTPIIPLVSNSQNVIQIFQGFTFSTEINVELQVTSVCLSPHGKYIIYGLLNGEIHLYNRRTKRTVKYQKLLGRGAINFLKCHKLSNNNIVPTDTDDYVIISLCENDYLVIHRDPHKYFSRHVKKPQLFFNKDHIICVEGNSEIFKLNLYDCETHHYEDCLNAKNKNLSTAAFCKHRNLLSIIFTQGAFCFLSFVSITTYETTLQNKIQLINRPRCCSFSEDGSFLAVGYDNGILEIYNLLDNCTVTRINAHDNAINQLLFYPIVEPILISLSEDKVSWWNFKSIKKPIKPGLRLFLSIPNDNESDLDIGFWTSLKTKNEFLLSCLKLNGKATYITPSDDFQSFMIAHENGKFCIIAVIKPNY